jgi:peptide/nickel transport system substrate-binding protein
MGVGMDEQELRELVAAVKARRVSRRTFVRRMVGLGLTAPFATQLLASAGLAQSPAPVDYRPTHAGGGGALRAGSPNFMLAARTHQETWLKPLAAK